MTIYPIILLVIFGILFAFAIDRKVQEVLPIYIFAFVICLFGLAVLKKPHHAFELSLVGFAATWGFYIFRKRRILPSISDITQMFSPLPVGLTIYAVVLIVMYFAYGNHIVNNWDDFHFNATFARDMFTYGGMPTGWKAATGYKSYKPFMQMFYNWGFQANGYYSEPLMFRYKIYLVYTACLPLFNMVDKVKGALRKITVAVFTIVIPYAFMYEMVDSLSMDGMMGLLTAYTLVAMCFEKERDWFCYTKIAIGLISLTLVKSSAIMFTAICCAVWFFVELHAILDVETQTVGSNTDGDKVKNDNKTSTELPDVFKKFRNKTIATYIGICGLTGCAWLSWKIFCDRNGNVTFLNNILDDHLDNNTGLPWFGKDTIINGFKGLFTTSMNLGKFSLSLMAVALIVAIIGVILFKQKKCGKEYGWIYFILLGGIVPYYAVLMYTYIYVFFEYEAIALASYDRYLGTYALAILYFAFYHLINSTWEYDSQDENNKLESKVDAEHAIKGTNKMFDGCANYLPTAITAIVVLSLNFPVLYRGLIPSVYVDYRSSWIEARAEAEMEMASVMPENVEAEQLLIVSNENQSVYGRGLDLAALPLVANEVVIKTLKQDLYSELSERFASENVKYVYFSHRLTHDDIVDCDKLSVDGLVEPGVMYMVDEDTNMMEIIDI